MLNDDAPAPAPPQLSPDGRWWWDGAAWVPAAQRPVLTGPAGPASFAGPSFPQRAYAAPGYAPGGTPGPGTSLGIVSFVLSLLWLGGLGSIAAIVTGHVSRSKDRRAGAPQSGLALAGLVLGYVGVVLLPLLAAVAIPTFLHQRELASAAAARSELRDAALVQEALMTDSGRYATSVEELEAAGYTGAPAVRLEVLAGDGRSWYCLGAARAETGDPLYLDSRTGGVGADPCS